MSDIECPWCGVELPVVALESAAGSCAECMTTWTYEDADEFDLALAA